MVFCNKKYIEEDISDEEVTILILVDGFLQLVKCKIIIFEQVGHNPYFSRWFSAINFVQCAKKLTTSHNPYFSRWFSAMRKENN